MIIHGPDSVRFTVGKLPFNHVRTKLVFIQYRAGSAAKAMPRKHRSGSVHFVSRQNI